MYMLSFLVVLGLCWYARAFSGRGKRELLSIAMHGLLLWNTGSQAAVAEAHGISCSAASGIFLDQGLNPCLLHWQEETLLLIYQGSPLRSVLLVAYRDVKLMNPCLIF